MQPVVKNLEAVPEALRGEYVQQGDVFVLKLDGDIPGFVPESRVNELAGKVDEFRGNNTRLLKALGAEGFDQALTRLGALGQAEQDARALRERVADFERRGINRGDDVAALVKRAVAEATTPLTEKVAGLERERDEARQRLSASELDAMLTSIGLEVGVDERALPDFIRRGRDVWSRNDDGDFVSKDAKGRPLFSRANPGEALSPAEWALSLADEAPHLFRGNTGAGAPGGESGIVTDRHGTQWVAPDALEIGRNLEDIASGKMRVAGQD